MRVGIVSGWGKLGAAVYYGLASSAVQMSNKALFTTYGFNFPLFVAALQLSATAAVTYLVGRPKLQRDTVRDVLPLAVINVLNCITGLISTAGLNVPIFIALRRFTLIFTILLDYYLFRKVYDAHTIASVGVMVGGAMLAALTDLTFNLLGYTAVFCNNIFTALYLVTIRHTKEQAAISTLAVMFYTSVLSLPLLLVSILLSREPFRIALYLQGATSGFQAVLVSSCLLGFAVNHATFLCTYYNDPLTTSVTGNIKNIALTIIGAFAFGDFVFEVWNVTGLVVSMLGAVWYSTRIALKEREHQRQAQAGASRSASPTKVAARGRAATVDLKARAGGRGAVLPTRSSAGTSEIRPLLDGEEAV